MGKIKEVMASVLSTRGWLKFVMYSLGQGIVAGMAAYQLNQSVGKSILLGLVGSFVAGSAFLDRDAGEVSKANGLASVREVSLVGISKPAEFQPWQPGSNPWTVGTDGPGYPQIIRGVPLSNISWPVTST